MNPKRLFGSFALVGGLVMLPTADDVAAGVPTSGTPGWNDVATLPRARARWKAEGNQASAWFGSSVGTAGDVNGDGYDDVIVGALFYDNGELSEGRAFLFLGSPSGPSTSPDWTAEGNQAGAWFGSSVNMAGDVNGDGYDDVIIGAASYDNGEEDEGRAFVYYGSPSGLSATPAWTAEGDQERADFGQSVGSAGDVNGDGYDDVVVGAEAFNNGQIDEGRAFVYYGSASGPSPTPDWTAEGDQVNANFGTSVGTAGDVNGDGYDDVVVGAFRYGRAFAYHGSASGLSATPDWTAETDQGDAGFGISVGSAGDVNGDGYDDVVVGEFLYDNGQEDEGRALVYHGSASGLSVTPDWTAEGDQENARFGVSVGTAGDVNGDGYDDVVVGALFYDNGQGDEGGIFVYGGSSSGLSMAPQWTAESNQSAAVFGSSAGTAGDVDGDGFDDVIGGAFLYDHDLADEGAAVVFRGRPTMARPR